MGTGYSNEDLKELNARLKGYTTEYERPSNIKRGSTWPSFLHPWHMKSDDVPDVFITPNHSVIMEIKCAELVVTDQFSAGKTPRFPRCVNIRYDKGWYEAMTQKELLELKRDSVISAEDAGGGQARRNAKKKRPSRPGTQVVEGMSVVSKDVALQGKTLLSNIFAKSNFSVIPWSDEKTIPAMKGLLLPWSKRGGNGSSTVTQSQSISQLTQGDLVGLEPEDAAKIAEQRKIRSKKLSVSDMQTLLYQHGAETVVGAALTEGVDYIVTIDPSAQRVVNMVANFTKNPSQTCDVVMAAWIYDSIVAGERQPLHFEYLVHASNDTKG